MLTATDLFCGAGGSSLGAEASGVVELRMAANHWTKAIEVHQANFPGAAHDCADISQVDPRRYPRTDILLASPECTNHSNAKGISRKAQHPSLFEGPDPGAERSRATMWDVHRFVEQHRYDAVVVENVVDASRWIYWRSWWQAWDDAGYDARVVSLNSAHTGEVHQWRDRIYVVATRRGLPTPDLELRPPCWCPACERVVAGVQVFKKPGQPIGKWRTQYAYRCPDCNEVTEPPAPPAADVIDWTLPAGRIGDRERPLRPATIERIRRGLEKYGPHLVAASGNVWDGVNTGGAYTRVWPLDGPTPTQACRFQHAVAHPAGFTVQSHHRGADDSRIRSFDEPHFTMTASRDYAGLVLPHRTNGRARPADVEPFATMCAGPGGGGQALVMAPQSDGRAQPTDRPAPSMTTKGTAHLIVPYHRTAVARPATEPHGTASTHDREAVVSMALRVDDCHYRMLEAHEVKAAMAFPDAYVAEGTKTDLVKLWGNAVTPPVMTMIVRRLAEALT